MQDYLARREALIRESHPGPDAARALSDLTDEVVRDLSRAASSLLSGRYALVALGGWGAGALLPGSDLDILVLAEGSSAKLKPFVEAVLYPLWDAGLKVGHQVRSPREQLRAMRDDLATCTAALTARPLAGDCEWAGTTLAACARDANKRSRTLSRDLAARPRPGTPYALEPDLKEDAGGRRDYDELVWRAAVATGSVQREPSALITAGLATADEIASAVRAAQVVTAARFALSRSGLGNRMTLDAAQTLAETPGAPDAEQVQRALARTALVLQRVRHRASGDVVLDDAPMSPSTVFAALDTGDAALPVLEEAAQSGRLDALLPGFADLMTVRRPGIGHELTVGAHSLRAAVLVADQPQTGALARSWTGSAPLMRALQVATLAHDAGKAEPGPGHAERGAQSAREAAARFGLDPTEAHVAEQLVRLHLELIETATRIDLDDEDSVLEAAARIGERALLAPLHVLTAADSIATGPATWSAWTATLVGTLVSRLDAALAPEVDGAGIAARGEATRTRALAETPTTLPAERAFIELAPLRYLASREPDEVVRHARLVAELSTQSTAVEAAISVSAGPAAETHAVTVVAADRPDLLARIAGAMSLAGLNILAVDAYGSSGGIVLDTFVVASATLRPVTTETFTVLERLLRAALRDRLELQTRLAERRRHYPARVQGDVGVQIASAAWDTAVRVTAPDRPGLLHDLARAVSSAGCDIRWAKVLTVDGMALDTFHVTGADGGPVDDPGVLGHLSMRLREVR